MQMTIVNKAKVGSLATPAASPVFVTLLPIMGVVFVAFLVIGLALPVLPLHVHQALGFGTFTVGLVTGSQFAASLFSRVWSGRTCDNQGPKYAVIVGCRCVGSRCALSAFASPRAEPRNLGRHPTPGPRRAGRGGKLHHHGSNRLGLRARWRTERRQSDRLDGHGDVRCFCGR